MQRTVRTALVTGVIALALSGCFTGKRPHFAPEEPAVTDPAALAVLQRLDAPTSTSFTATYSILTTFGATTTPAVVAQKDSTNRSITIGDIRFIESPNGDQTCNLTTSVCVTGLDDAQVSNVSVTHQFAGGSPATRLRNDIGLTTSPAVASNQTVAGQTAICAQVAFGAGSSLYCALDNGLLALQDTADLEITLVTLTNGAASDAFTPTTVAG